MDNFKVRMNQKRKYVKEGLNYVRLVGGNMQGFCCGLAEGIQTAFVLCRKGRL
jgi:hypothetical protein